MAELAEEEVRKFESYLSRCSIFAFQSTVEENGMKYNQIEIQLKAPDMRLLSRSFSKTLIKEE
jgi:hypothetical protein